MVINTSNKKGISTMTKEKTIKILLGVVESKHPEISIYRDSKELKERYVKGEFENDIEILRDFGNNDIFFNEDGSFPEANSYILYTTCSGDDTIYTNISEFIKNHRKLLDNQDKNVLNIIDKLINNYNLDKDEQKYVHELLKEEKTMTRKERKEKLQDLLLILKKFYGNEDGTKYILKNYNNVNQPKKIEEGIDIAVEMLYDKMNEGLFLNDVAQMIKDNFTAEDFIFDGAEIVLNKIDPSGNVIFSSTYTIYKATEVDDEYVFDLMDPYASVEELALPTEDEYTIKNGKLYIDADFGVLEIYPNKKA